MTLTADDALKWYLLRTKAGKERWVRDQLSTLVPGVFLPMLKARAPARSGLRPCSAQ